MIWPLFHHHSWARAIIWVGLTGLLIITWPGCDYFSEEKPQPAPNKIKSPVTAQTKPTTPPAQPAKAGQPPAASTQPGQASTTGQAPKPADKAKADEQARLSDQPSSKPGVSSKPAGPKTAKAEKEDPKAQQKLTIESLQAMLEAKKNAYAFKMEGVTDPFRPIPAVMAAKAAENQGPAPEELTPLQKMELSQVKLVAVVTSSSGGPTRALVEDSTGMGYIVQLGTPIGRRNGKINGIFADRVEVLESFKNYLGEEKTNLAVLKLYPMEEEQKRSGGGAKGTMKVQPKEGEKK